MLAARRQGDWSSDAPLVLLHGFGAAGFAWDPVLARLSPGRPCLVLDLPGHGGSIDAADGGAGRMAKAIAADLTERGIGPVHLAGHSLGGAVAALIALRDPARVLSLTLVAPGGFGATIAHAALAAYGQARTEAEIAAGLGPFFADPSLIDDALVRRFADARAHPSALASLAAILSSMLTEASGRTEQGVLPLADLGRLECPVSLAWGTKDAILPASQADGLAATIRVERLTGLGHMLMDEAPGEIARLIEETIAAAGARRRN